MIAVPTYKDLLTVQSATDLAEEIYQAMRDRGLPVDSWSSASVPVVLVEQVAKFITALSVTRVQLAEGQLLDTAQGDFLTTLAYGRYQTRRKDTSFAEVDITIQDTSSFGPITLNVGSHWFTSSAGLRYNNKTGGTIPLNGDLVITLIAEKAGSVYNTVDPSTVWTWNTPYSGFTVVNGGEVTVQAVDVEEDPALVARSKEQVDIRGMGLNADAWKYWVSVGSDQVTRCNVISNPGGVPALTRLIIAGKDGAFETNPDPELDVVTLVDATAQEVKTNATVVEVQSAVNRTVNLVGSVHVKAGFMDLVQTNVPLALQDVQESLDIGGVVYQSKLTAAIEALDGIHHVEWSIASTIELEEDEVVQFDLTNLAYIQE